MMTVVQVASSLGDIVLVKTHCCIRLNLLAVICNLAVLSESPDNSNNGLSRSAEPLGESNIPNAPNNATLPDSDANFPVSNVSHLLFDPDITSVTSYSKSLSCFR